ncbi:hypothetical protein GJ698_02145 [Pseudoduganella sp. FT26W]|uniref:Uncharacterized protein n=1 Tax=Duganella aquatilis TaxID=2666082 RepID=A0A844D5W0_9BURK|nr:hypothetical protein [Duganella aquatilis]MRW82890.1 hypothetical protein [Duganella aquatilis]
MLPPAPRLSSEQEQIVENFINLSFGTARLYRSERYSYVENGKKLIDEPCDLFWYGDGVVVLFNLTKSRLSAGKQTKHNVDQLRKYIQRWKTHDECFTLVGENRFGTRCSVPFADVERIVAISLIGRKCGITALPCDPYSEEIWINAPDVLLEQLAEFSGSLVDLLLIAFHCINSPDKSYTSLTSYIKEYVNSALENSDIREVSVAEGFTKDVAAIQRYLEFPKYVNEAARLQYVFDLSLVERSVLVHAALQLLHKSEPPNFKYSYILVINGTYYHFVLATVHMNSSNFQKVVQDGLNLMEKNNNGELESIFFGYACYGFGEDYRSPSFIAVGPGKRRSQAKHFIDIHLSRRRRINTLFNYPSGIYSFQHQYVFH